MNDHFLAPLYDLAETAPLLTTVWIGFVGGCIGSFLNVVVYRSPRGMSLSHPPSRCPNCERRIRWYDNLPVMGWVRLRGRCRDCHQPISVRYPIVEAIVAVAFVTYWVLDVTLSSNDWPDRGGAFLWHTLPFCSLFCAGLIDWDQQQVPRKVIGVAGIGGALMLLATGAQGSWVPSVWGLNPWIGMALNSTVGLIMTDVVRRRPSFNPNQQTRLVFHGVGILLGLFLGPLKSVGVILFSCLAVLIWRRANFGATTSSVSWLLCSAVFFWIANLM